MTKVTIYHSSTFGVSKIEATVSDYGTKKYAQYENAPFVQYVPKGKRKATGFIKGYQPYLVIIDGHDHLDPNDPFTASNTDGIVTTKQTRFASFDERYKTEFDSILSNYIKDKIVLMDVRHTIGTNVINK